MTTSNTADPAHAPAGVAQNKDDSPQSDHDIPESTKHKNFEKDVIVRIVWSFIFFSVLPAFFVFSFAGIEFWQLFETSIKLDVEITIIEIMNFMKSELISFTAGFGVLFIYGVFFEQSKAKSDGSERGTLTALTKDGRMTVWFLLSAMMLTFVAHAIVHVNRKNWVVLAEPSEVNSNQPDESDKTSDNSDKNISEAYENIDENYKNLKILKELLNSSLTFNGSLLIVLIGLRPHRAD